MSALSRGIFAPDADESFLRQNMNRYHCIHVLLSPIGGSFDHS